MLSPLKLSVIVCGAAAGLAVAPYLVKQVLPVEPVVAELAVDAEQASEEISVVDSSAKIDLPVAAPAASVPAPVPAAAIVPVATAAPVVQPEVAIAAATPRAELELSVPPLPSPAPVTPVADLDSELSLPSLASPQMASAAMPSPAITPPPAPSPTPEIPYRSEVEAAQKLMKQLGIDTGKIDGKLGPNTQAAVRKFREEHSLKESTEVDDELIRAMEKAVAALPTPTPASKVEVTDAKPSKSDAKDVDVKDADDPDVVIMRKGRSSAERESGKKTAAAPKVNPGPVPTLQNMKDVRKLQEQLKLAGTYEGEVDGKWGDLTRAAMREFQKKAGVEVTGRPNKETWLAMHSGAVRPEGAADEPETAVAAADDDDADELAISSVESEPTRGDEPVVVNVNGDGISDPDAVEPIATPRSVTRFNSDADVDDAGSDKSSDAGETPSDLAVAAENRDEQIEKLRRELESRRSQIQTVGSDYEVKKYAPKTLETVNNMMDEFKIETVSNNPAEARERLAKIDKEIERAKSESMRKKAAESVEDVRKSYDSLKEHFPTRIKSLSLEDSEEKALREDLTELVAKVDLGFEAMEKDLKAGNYDPIFENCADFRQTIDAINSRVADAYLQARLKEKSTKSKLAKSKLSEIEELQEAEEHLKAADLLDSELSSKKKS